MDLVAQSLEVNMNNSKLISNITKKYEFKIDPSKNIRREYFYRFKKRYYKFIGKEKKFLNSNTIFKDLSKNEFNVTKILSEIDNMSSIAVGFIINQIAKKLDKDDVYLNIGIYRGFSLLAGILDAECKVYGVDNFSHEYLRGDKSLIPRDDISENIASKKYFFSYFNKYKDDKKHKFFEIDYKKFFHNFNEYINFYYYDADHSYENQLENLLIANEFLKKNAIILVDDYNEEQVERATLDFIARNSTKFKIIKEFKTANRFIHPTYANGIILFEKHS